MRRKFAPFIKHNSSSSFINSLSKFYPYIRVAYISSIIAGSILTLLYLLMIGFLPTLEVNSTIELLIAVACSGAIAISLLCLPAIMIILGWSSIFMNQSLFFKKFFSKQENQSFMVRIRKGELPGRGEPSNIVACITLLCVVTTLFIYLFILLAHKIAPRDLVLRSMFALTVPSCFLAVSFAAMKEVTHSAKKTIKHSFLYSLSALLNACMFSCIFLFISTYFFQRILPLYFLNSRFLIAYGLIFYLATLGFGLFRISTKISLFRQRLLVVFVASICIPVLIGCGENMLRDIFSTYGIREENKTIFLSKQICDNLSIVTNEKVCHQKTNTYYIKNVDVLWNIGQLRLKIPYTTKKNHLKYIAVTLNTDEAKIL